jgi:CheY-like chemotaxis protein
MFTAETAPGPTQILLVDDDPQLARTLADLLQREGYEVALARDGRGAMKQLARHRFALVISDIFMPDSDGIELLEHIRRLPAPPPVLAISGTNVTRITGMLRIAAALGAVRTLTKPFAPAALLAVVGELAGPAIRALPPATTPVAVAQ